MYYVSWQYFNKYGEIKTKEKAFISEEARSKFLEKLTQKDNFYRILNYSR